MTFKDASSIQTVVQQMRIATLPLAENRARINWLFNGNQPWTEEERKANKIWANYNSLEGPVRAHQAVQQMENALLKPGEFFKISLDRGPRWAREQWSAVLTEEVNRLLKRSGEWKDLLSNMSRSVTLHGIQPVYWTNKYAPIPVELGIDDVFVPTRTYTNMRNLPFYAIYREWTWAELYEMTHGKQVDPGWNQELVSKMLAGLAKQELQPTWSGNRWLMPEKLEEDLKSNSGFFVSSAAPVIYAWDFFYHEEEEDEEGAWVRRIVLDYDSLQPESLRSEFNNDDKNCFLYDSKKRKQAYSKDWRQQIHWQFGNVSLVAPCRYHSVRSYGYLLYSICLVQNHLRCRFTDSIFESLLQYFRNVGEDDREKLEKVDLLHMGTVPDGLQFVTKNERWEVNEQLALMGISQNQQLMDASSAAYMPDARSGARGLTPETATAEIIRAQTSAALTSAMLNQTYEGITPLYREVCRRLVSKESRHPMHMKLVSRLLEGGIPPQALSIVLDVDNWDIEPSRVLGGGNRAIEQLQASQLMQWRAAYDPQSQRQILHKATLAFSDAATANLLVPLTGAIESNAPKEATMAVGVLLQGLPYPMPRNVNPVEYAGVILQLLGQVAQEIQGLDEAQTPGVEIMIADKLTGFFNAAQHVGSVIQLVSQDEPMREQAAQLEAGLQELIQAVAPIAQSLQQRMQEQQQQGAQVPPEVQAKIAATAAMAQQKMQIASMTAEQKQQHKDAAFSAEIERRDAKTAQEIQEQNARTANELENTTIKTRGRVLQELQKQAIVGANESTAK